MPIIEQQNFVKTTKICVKNNGEIVQEICQPQLSVSATCTYTIEIDEVPPLTINNYIKNGNTYTIGAVQSDETQLDTYFSSLGFTKIGTCKYQITTPDTWTSVNITHGVDTSTINFTKVCPTPTDRKSTRLNSSH